jgi:hypothetical protein
MSRLKELKNHPENNVNLVDLVSMVIPNEKAAYVETLFRIMKNTEDYTDVNAKVRATFIEDYNIPKDKVNAIPDFQLLLYYKFIDSFFNREDLKSFQKFCELNERKLIENPDLTTYSSFSAIDRAVDAAELKINMKELEKQVKKIYESDEYVMIRPLTYQSSLKYGANTKWCTASSTNFDYYRKYVKRGILLYIINKRTGTKTACFKAIDGESEFSFWNQMDVRIDSMESGLPDVILMAISNEIKNNPVPNRSYLSEGEIKLEDFEYQKSNLKASSSDYAQETAPDLQWDNGDRGVREERVVQEDPRPVAEMPQNTAQEVGRVVANMHTLGDAPPSW